MCRLLNACVLCGVDSILFPLFPRNTHARIINVYGVASAVRSSVQTISASA